MAYGSSVPSARAALHTLIDARPGLDGITVLARPPATEAQLKSGSAVEVVHLGRWDTGISVDGRGTQAHMAAGRLVIDETYLLWVSVQAGGGTTATTETTASERAWTLAFEVIGAVSVNPDLNLELAAPVVKCGATGEIAFDESVARHDTGGAVSRIAIGFTIDARIVAS